MKKPFHNFNLPVLIFFLFYFSFWWLYKLDILPGLHADEAWSGIKAYKFSVLGVEQVVGMNKYTGILQTLLSSFFFKTMGYGVLQLRIGSVILNVAALVLLTSYLITQKKATSAIVFLLIIAQSTFYLSSPRVAWEVNTFTLPLIICCYVALCKINQSIGKAALLYCWIFLMINIIGTYNHVIFSCVPVSALIAAVLWRYSQKTNTYNKYILLFLVNLFNIIIVFLLMRYYDEFLCQNILLVGCAIILLVYGEVIIYNKALAMKPVGFGKLFINKIITGCLLCVCLLSFVCFHGRSFFEIILNYYVLLHLYSFETAILFKYLFIASAICFVGCLVMYLYQDIRKKQPSIFSFFIITYIGLLNIYTRGTSYRYYLCLFVIVALYLAFKYKDLPQIKKIFITSLLVSFCLVNLLQYNIFFNSNRKVKAIVFERTLGHTETSAHFLNKEPVIEYLTRNNIKEIKCLTRSCYFLMRPIKFYKIARPWKETSKDTVSISYDYYSYGNGFIVK